MSFGNPWFLLALIFPLIAAVGIRRLTMQAPKPRWQVIRRVSILGNRVRFAAPQAMRPAFITLGAIALVILALAKPRWGEQTEEMFVNTREVMIALDLSRSMLTEDVEPSRLEHARKITTDLLDSLKGESVGLVVFSGTSFVQVPLSPDYHIIREFLPILDTDYLPQGGTDYTGMLQAALEGFSETADTDRYLIVLSDGESSTDGWNAKLDALIERDVHIVSMGLGTEKGAFIPDGEGGYLVNEDGDTIYSKLTTTTLEAIAKRTNGKYINASSLNDIDDVKALLADTVEKGRKGRFNKESGNTQKERFQWVLLPAILLGLYGLFKEFQQRPRPRQIRQKQYTGGSKLKSALAMGATLAIAIAAAAPQARAHFDTDAGFEVREVFDSNPIKRVRAITEHLAEYDYDAYDLRLLVEETIKYGLDSQRTETEITEGVIRDAIDATYQGEKLDTSVADWNYYRSQLTAMLEPIEKEEAKREEESQAKKEQLDEEDNPPTVTGQSSSQAASDSFGQGSSAKTDAALGELTSDQKLAPPRPKKLPPPPKRARMTAKASSGSGGNDVSNDPILALNMKRLEEVNKKDSPGRLHQLLAESLEQQDSNAFDW